MNEDDLRDLVARERQRRGYLSVRSAAVEAEKKGAPITNSSWSAWENGTSKLGIRLQKAIAAVLDWPLDWPTAPPVGDAGVSEKRDVFQLLDSVMDRLTRIEAHVGLVADRDDPPADQAGR